VPSMVYPASSSRDQFYTNSSALVEKGDNIRLQDVNLSYNVQRLGNTPMKHLRLYTFLTNPGFLWRANKLGLDPDYSGFLPVTPSISFGLKANF
jgi:TonB-dependent starch-binding outer membrane protein SusC